MKRAERDYAVQVLRDKQALLHTLGPATDHPELALRQEQALHEVVEYLTRRRFTLNPFV